MGTPISEWDPIAGGGASIPTEDVCREELVSSPSRPLSQAAAFVCLAALAWSAKKRIGHKPKDVGHFKPWQHDRVRLPLLLILVSSLMGDLAMVTSIDQLKDNLMIYLISSVQIVILVLLPHQRWRQVSVQMHIFAMDQLWVIVAALAYPSLAGRIGAAHVTNYFLFRQFKLTY